MSARRFGLACAAVALLGTALTAPAAARLRVNGSTTVNPVVEEAAQILRRERGLAIVVDTLGGSSGGIAALGDGRAEVAMSSRPLVEADRRKFPGVAFHAVAIGRDAVALAVSKDVWEAGVRSLTRGQVRAIYEGEILNWSGLGGPDRRIVFFNKEPGRGTWEVFARWLYDEPAAAPLVSLPEVGSNEEGRSKVRSTRGALTQLSEAWVDGREIFALGVELEDGSVAQPTDPAYPLSRLLYLVTDGAPEGEASELIDFLLGERGRQLVTDHGYRPLAEPERGAP